MEQSLKPNQTLTLDTRRKTNSGDISGEDDCDGEVWEALNSVFEKVQTLLDKNRALIQQVNENQQSKVAENLVKNVGLIREINGNISKVMSIYSDLSLDFSKLVRQRKDMAKKKDFRLGKVDGNKVVDDATL